MGREFSNGREIVLRLRPIVLATMAAVFFIEIVVVNSAKTQMDEVYGGRIRQTGHEPQGTAGR